MKKIIFLIVIFLLIADSSKAVLFEHLKDVVDSGVIKHYNIGVDKSDDDNIYILYKDFDDKLWLKTKNFSKIIKTKVDKFKMYVGINDITIIWTEYGNRFMRYMILDKSNLKKTVEKSIYLFRSISVYNIDVINDKDKIVLVFIEQYKHHSNLKIVFFTKQGEILHLKTVVDKGYNFMPVIKKYKNKSYFLLWNNINGERKKFFYTFYRNNNWSGRKLLTDNNFDNVGADVCIYKDSIYIVWQNNRLGNWNISFARIKNYKIIENSMLTSEIFNLWQPKIVLYMGKLFMFWIDESYGNPNLFFRSYNVKTKLWSDDSKVYSPDNIMKYNLLSGKFIVISYIKNKNSISVLKRYNKYHNFNLKVSKNNNEITIHWNNDFEDIKSYGIDFSINTKTINTNIYMPVLSNKSDKFFCYLKNPSKLKNLYFNFICYDDLGIKSKVLSVPLIKNNKEKKYIDPIIWKDMDDYTIYYNFVKNKLFDKARLLGAIDKYSLISKLYFHTINYFPESKNKFIDLFDSLNEYFDFDRSVKGDTVLLPLIWGDTIFVSKISKNVKSTLEQMEKSFNIVGKGYIYYFVSNDFQKIIRSREAGQGDFIVVMVK